MRCARLVFVLVISFAAPAAAAPNIAIAQGALAGGDEDGIATYKGIPFAAPPVGEWRWRAPQPAAHWAGVRDATGFGASCPQSAMGFGDKLPQSEDCLSLNVWSPTPRAGAKLPVMMWIYGGAFRQGSSAMALYDGTDLAKHGVVVVSFNYRLGWLGFFAHPSLVTENKAEANGNYGLMDQIAALEWVRDNIASFGGDPANVTIFGESAGGMSVNDLMASPKARGLFAKAISESGLGLQAMQTRAEAEAAANEFAARQKVSGDGPEALAALRKLPADVIVADQHYATVAALNPMVDGVVIPQQVSVAFAKGDIAHVPYLAGSNSDEATLMSEIGMSPDTLLKPLGDKLATVRKIYEGNGTLSDDAFGRQFFGDALFGGAVQALATFAHRAGAPAYTYQFAYVADSQRGKSDGVGHGGELGYVWGIRGLKTMPYFKRIVDAVTPKDTRIGAAVRDYWTNFAKTGNPNGAGLPHWPAFEGAAPATLVFDDTIHPVPDFRKPQIEVSFMGWSNRTGIPAPF